MTTTVKLRTAAGRDLTWSEVDQNFSDLAGGVNTNAADIVTLNDEVAALAAGSVPVTEVFVAGIGFTPGASTTLALARSYGSISNVTVHFDTAYQGPDQIASIVGNTLTFNSVIPVGVSNVYVKGGTVQSVGVPPAQSVGVPQLGTDTKAYFVKTADLAASSGAGLMGWIRNAANAVATTLAKWMGWQTPSVFEFMTDAQVTAAQAMSTSQDLAATLNNAFASGNKTIRLVGPARYTIGSPLYLTSGLTVLCDDNAEVYLKDNARCFMIRTVTTGLTNIKWLGGIINGNDANQGDEAADGANYDVSKGFYLVNVDGLEVGNLTIKTIRGHGFNHWNCNNFNFHDFVFDQTVDTIQPTGGRRRDGITGSSSNGIIRNVSGFTGDDMVALLCGVDWSGAGTVPQDVENVQILNIRGQKKAGQNTWRGAVLYTLNGYKADKVSIDDVYGDFAEAIVQVGSYGAYTTGKVGTLSVGNFGGLAPKNDGLGNRIPIWIYNVDIDVMTLSDGKIQYTDVNVGTGDTVKIDKCHINTLHIDNLTAIDICTTDVVRNLVNIKNNGIRDLHLTDVANYSTTFPNSTNKIIISRSQTGGDGSGAVNVFGRSWNIGRETVGLTKINTVVVSGDLVPFTPEVVCGLSSIATPVTGAIVTDLNVGVAQYDGGRWNQVTIPGRYYANALPTSGNWKAGHMFTVSDSPYGAIYGYLNRSSTAPFDWHAMASNIVQNGLAANFSAALSTYASGVCTVLEISATESAPFPGGLPGILTTYRSATSDTFAYQEYRVRQANTMYARYWDGAAWTAFVQTTVV